MRFASGKNTRAVCDRCGLEFKLHELRKEWTNLKVCSSCWEPKHPQLELKGRSDRVAVRDPRPGQHFYEDNTVFIKVGLTSTGFIGDVGNIVIDDTVVIADGFEITSSLGEVSLFIGTLVNVDGVQSDTFLGDTNTIVDKAVQGVQSLTNIPTVGITVDDLVTPAGFQIIGSLGDVSVFTDGSGWSDDTWSNGAWSQ